MLHKAKDLQGLKLGAVDAEVGHVKEFYFDDHHWTVRYLVADTGGWLPGKQVLISPFALKQVRPADRLIEVSLTREKIENSPSISSDMPVSRQYEAEYYKYYGWPMYWYGPALWGPAPFPVFGHGGAPSDPNPPREETGGDPHLRSTTEVRGYHIHATDGMIGHMEDCLLDDENWKIRYLVVDTRNWWPGKKVLISTDWITGVSWDRSSVEAHLSRDVIKGAPEYQDHQPLTREDEARLFSYYKQEAYWSREQAKAELADE